jgi:hypothetical protein
MGTVIQGPMSRSVLKERHRGLNDKQVLLDALLKVAAHAGLDREARTVLIVASRAA